MYYMLSYIMIHRKILLIICHETLVAQKIIIIIELGNGKQIFDIVCDLYLDARNILI